MLPWSRHVGLVVAADVVVVVVVVVAVVAVVAATATVLAAVAVVAVGEEQITVLHQPQTLGTQVFAGLIPEGPCTQIVDTLALKYLNRDYFKAKVYSIWVHGPLGNGYIGIVSVSRISLEVRA